MDYERNPRKSRMYARVIAPGTVSEGDPVDLM
jgi:MOSC domain-containing protein YiiM